MSFPSQNSPSWLPKPCLYVAQSRKKSTEPSLLRWKTCGGREGSGARALLGSTARGPHHVGGGLAAQGAFWVSARHGCGASSQSPGVDTAHRCGSGKPEEQRGWATSPKPHSWRVSSLQAVELLCGVPRQSQASPEHHGGSPGSRHSRSSPRRPFPCRRARSGAGSRAGGWCTSRSESAPS